jgi:hypothetical protein
MCARARTQPWKARLILSSQAELQQLGGQFFFVIILTITSLSNIYTRTVTEARRYISDFLDC